MWGREREQTEAGGKEQREREKQIPHQAGTPRSWSEPKSLYRLSPSHFTRHSCFIFKIALKIALGPVLRQGAAGSSLKFFIHVAKLALKNDMPIINSSRVWLYQPHNQLISIIYLANLKSITYCNTAFFCTLIVPWFGVFHICGFTRCTGVYSRPSGYRIEQSRYNFHLWVSLGPWKAEVRMNLEVKGCAGGCLWGTVGEGSRRGDGRTRQKEPWTAGSQEGVPEQRVILRRDLLCQGRVSPPALLHLSPCNNCSLGEEEAWRRHWEDGCLLPAAERRGKCLPGSHSSWRVNAQGTLTFIGTQ